MTNTRRATLSDGQITHDAQIQTVDVTKNVFIPARGPSEINFKDSYRYNIAGYELALLLGPDNVPVSVERRVEGRQAAMTWWIDDVLMDEGKRNNRDMPGLAMRGLTFDAVKMAVGNSLDKGEIDAMLTRRDEIVKLFDQKISLRGEGPVLLHLSNTVAIVSGPSCPPSASRNGI